MLLQYQKKNSLIKNIPGVARVTDKGIHKQNSTQKACRSEEFTSIVF